MKLQFRCRRSAQWWISFVVLALVGSSSLQVHAADGWKPLEAGQLAMTAPVVDKGADAEVLLWDVHVAYLNVGSDIATVLEHYVRVKVFNERGRESQSKIDIYAPQFGGRRIRITEVAAHTVKPDGTAIELKKEDIYDRVVLKGDGIKVNAKSFALPGVVSGAIVEYRWREIRDGIEDYERFDFSRDIPVQLVKYYVKPYSDTLVDSKGRDVAMRAETFNGKMTPFVKDKDGYFGTSMTNVRGFNYEPQMPPEYAVRPWLLVYYAANVASSPDQFWRDYGKEMASSMKASLKANSDVQKAAAEFVSGPQSPEEKLEKLFNFVQRRIKRYTDDASGLTPEQLKKIKQNDSPSDTLKRGTGDAWDINTLFGALAASAGFDVRVAFTSDRNDTFFDRSVANHYAVTPSSIAVRVNGQWRLFDPGSSYVTFGMLRWQEEGQDTLIADEKEPVWITSPFSEPSKSVETRTGKLKLSEDGTLEGDIRIEYTGHFAEERKEYNDDATPAKREETLKSRYGGAELTNISVENVTDPNKPFIYSFHIRVRGYAQRAGRRLLMKPAFFQRGQAPRFATSERSQMVYFHYGWTENDHVEIELPTGFVLDSPESPTPISAGVLTQYQPKLGATADGHNLVYERSLVFGKDARMLLFPLANYSALKGYFDAVYKQDDQAIALRPATP